jgi:hypothetical protein
LAAPAVEAVVVVYLLHLMPVYMVAVEQVVVYQSVVLVVLPVPAHKE